MCYVFHFQVQLTLPCKLSDGYYVHEFYSCSRSFATNCSSSIPTLLYGVTTITLWARALRCQDLCEDLVYDATIQNSHDTTKLPVHNTDKSGEIKFVPQIPFTTATYTIVCNSRRCTRRTTIATEEGRMSRLRYWPKNKKRYVWVKCLVSPAPLPWCWVITIVATKLVQQHCTTHWILLCELYGSENLQGRICGWSRATRGGGTRKRGYTKLRGYRPCKQKSKSNVLITPCWFTAK